MERLDSRLRAVSPNAWPGLLSRISEIDECKGFWAGRTPAAGALLATLPRKVVAESAGSSIRIGWSGMPRVPAPPDSRRRTSPPAGAPASPAAAYARLLKEVFQGYPGMPLTAELVLRLHAGILPASPGDPPRRDSWRIAPDRSLLLPQRGMEAITLRPSNPENIPAEMGNLIAWANSRLDSGGFHPLVVVAGFLLEFHAIRPFAGGNGRTSRLLTNLLLLRRGYAYMPYASLEKAIEERRAEYYLALRKSQSTRNLANPDMTPWLAAFLDTLRSQARGLRRLLEETPPGSRLSANQAAVLELAGRHGEVTNRLAAGTLGLPRETAKQVLNRLLSLNLLERSGSGRATRYRKPPG